MADVGDGGQLQTNDASAYGACEITVNIQSEPFWSIDKASTYLSYAIPRLQLQLAAIYLLTESLHRLLKRVHFPRFASEIMVGFLLGPTFLGKFEGFTETFFPQDGQILLDTISKFGYIFYMFLSGVKMDPGMMLTVGASSSSAWIIGVLAACIPFAGGMKLYMIAAGLRSFYRARTIRAIISVNNLVAFPVISRLLVDLKIMNSELGRLALASTLIADLISNILSIVSTNMQMGYFGWMNGYAVVTGFTIIVSLGLMTASMKPFSRRIIKQTPEGKPISIAYVLLLSAIALLSAIYADNIGIPYQVGPFLIGLGLPDGPPIGSTLVQKLETVMSGWLTPVIVTNCAMQVNFFEIFNIGLLSFLRIVVLICQIMKFSAILCPALLCKMPLKDAFALSFIMSAQGVVQMTYYSNYFISQAFDQEILLMLTYGLLETAIFSQLGVKYLSDQSRTYTGYQKRDILHLGPNAELRVLACSHRADDVVAVKKILEASFLNTENPLSVYALNLVELVGRAHPLLIDHQLGQKTSSTIGFHAQKVLEVYQSIQQQYIGRITIQVFTSLSLPMFMHHDVCSLAFDKITSMIILPFHRKWNPQGKLISENGQIRYTNLHVLNNAPCSVGILMDRHRIKNPNNSASTTMTYSIAVVFIGGSDDREALAYARKMARSPGVQLTVIRFVPFDQLGGGGGNEHQWDSLLDAEMLKETRLQGLQQDDEIVYKEERVSDGADTALHLHGLEDSFDLIMVGRRHREDCRQLSGLNEWTELPELGPVGDVYGATDINRPVSILVVQQQIVRTK